MNENYLGGHKPKELWVKPKCSDYKEETLQHLSIKDYNEFILSKAVELMKSIQVKSLIADYKVGQNIHFGIPLDKKIKIGHIISIILYCDMDDYSRKFSESFRKLYPHETLHSVKKRNQKYYWQSRFFKEAVECYGSYGYNEEQTPHGENGPFCMCLLLFNLQLLLVSLSKIQCVC